jgi:hypothetical protein
VNEEKLLPGSEARTSTTTESSVGLQTKSRYGFSFGPGVAVTRNHGISDLMNAFNPSDLNPPGTGEDSAGGASPADTNGGRGQRVKGGDRRSEIETLYALDDGCSGS